MQTKIFKNSSWYLATSDDFQYLYHESCKIHVSKWQWHYLPNRNNMYMKNQSLSTIMYGWGLLGSLYIQTFEQISIFWEVMIELYFCLFRSYIHYLTSIHVCKLHIESSFTTELKDSDLLSLPLSSVGEFFHKDNLAFFLPFTFFFF